MKLFGNVHRIEKEKIVGTNNFKVRNLIVKTVEQYPQVILVQFQQDKTSLLDGFEVGQSVEVEFNLNGRESIKEGSEPVVYNTLAGWRIIKK